MGIKMKKSAFFCLLIGLFVSCNTNPDDMAKEYCNCRAEVDKGSKTDKDCAELAESHTLKLQDEPGQLKVYTTRILDCISATKMNTQK